MNTLVFPQKQQVIEALPTVYQQVIHKSRYARWNEEAGRRETWYETVARFCNFMKKHLKEKYDYDTGTIDDPNTILGKVFNGIYYLEVMPSMRCLMTAGKALELENMCGFNCFSGRTRFLTKEGFKTFAETVGTKQIVLNGQGKWVEADIRSFGTQPLVRISFRPGNNSQTALRYTIEATPDHRWITLNRGETTKLQIGDQVRFVGAPASEIDPEAFIAGFGFGDGTLDTRGRARIRLCGDKNKWLKYFQNFGHCSVMYPPSYNGDACVVFHKGYFKDWKKLPSKRKSPEWLASWLKGYLEADATYDDRTGWVLYSQNLDALKFVESIAPYAGFMVKGLSTRSNFETNFGERSGPLHSLVLREEGEFRVTAIEQLEVEEEVFCAIVPDGHDFVLEHGIHTGNCTYRAITDTRAFAEIMYILMCGCGVGFSVERQFIGRLPMIPRKLKPSDEVIVVEDSRLGWAEAYDKLIHRLYDGVIPQWNVDKVRPAGARLKTMGGYASGPAPLVELFKFTIDIFKNAQGRRLNSLECHDIVCKIGDVVVMGGVRRSALISLSNPSDMRMRHAKMGGWYNTARWRELANNSAAYTEKPTVGAFMAEWLALYDSKSGERGIVNRQALINKSARIGRRTFWDDFNLEPEDPIDFGVNPCAEIILRSCQTCNLSEIVARPHDTVESLVHKAALASVIGTWQATLTNFNFVGPEWQANCEEERLLGVSVTGIMDSPILSARYSPEFIRAFQDMHNTVRRINEKWAEKLDISVAAAATCVKPSGTVSQLVNSASGVHSRYAPYYIRRVTMDNHDPMCQFLKDEGIPFEKHASKPDLQTVFLFPIRSPRGDDTPTTKDRSAIDQLEQWKAVNDYWAEHSVSCTIEVAEEEWPEVGGWVYKHFDQISGLSFIPKTGMVYQQPPYEAITEEECRKLEARMPKHLDWEKLSNYEKEDTTRATQELACTANGCMLD